jgi:predicted aspartyl protease
MRSYPFFAVFISTRRVERTVGIRRVRRPGKVWFWFWSSLCLLEVGASPGSAQVNLVPEYRFTQETVEIPFDYVQSQILVHGEVGPRKALTFLVDTGASTLVLDHSFENSGVRLGNGVLHEAEGDTAAVSIRLDDVRLGATPSGVGVHNVAGLITDLSQMSMLLGRRIDGIIGMSVLFGLVVEIDYEKHLLRLHAPNTIDLSHVRPDNQRIFLFDLIPLSMRSEPSGFLMVGQLANHVECAFLLDTGYGSYLSVPQKVAEQAGLLRPEMRRVPGTNYSVHGNFRFETVNAPALHLGALNLSGQTIQVDYLGKESRRAFGLMGNGFLQNYHVTLDCPHHKLLLERVWDRGEVVENEDLSFGMGLRREGEMLLVDHVARNSPAHRQGIWPGDHIVSIDGQLVETLLPDRAIHLLTAPHGATKLALVRGIDPILGSGGASYSVTLVPTSLQHWKAQ